MSKPTTNPNRAAQNGFRTDGPKPGPTAPKAKPATKVEAAPKSKATKVEAAPKPAKAPKPVVHCGCGCGAEVRSRFLPGHDAKLHSRQLAEARAALPPKLCGCGCGAEVQRRFKPGHDARFHAAIKAAAKAAA